MTKDFSPYAQLLNPDDRWELEKYLESAQRPIIFGHISPDGDSIGSSLAMFHLLRNRGMHPSVAMAGHVPHTLSWLPGVEEIMFVVGESYPPALDQALAEADLFLCLDFNVLSRTGSFLEQKICAALAKQRRALVVIDHHVEPSPEFDFIICKPISAATCEIIARLFMPPCELSAESPITPTVATCLLSGIITDTGLFNHASSYPEIFEVTADLLRCGADKDRIVREVFHRFSASRQRLEGYVLYEKIKIFPALKAACFSLSLEEQERFNVVPGDTEGLVNKPLDIEGVEVCAFFKETLYEGIKVSLRSKGCITVNDLAAEGFAGGGHLYAAGAEFTGTFAEAEVIFLDFLAKKQQPTQEQNP